MASSVSGVDGAARLSVEASAEARLATLARTQTRLSEATDQEGFTRQILAALLELTDARSGSFWLWDSSGETSLLASIGGGPDSVREALPEEALSAQSFSEEFLLRGSDASGAILATFLRIPLLVAGEYLGAYLLSGARALSPGDAEWARLLAQQAAPILRLTRRASAERQAALLEERNLLACEIHDALAQHLAGILLQLGLAQRIVGQQPEEAWRLVVQAGALARTAAQEARRSVWALQPAAAEYRDLVGSLPRAVARMTEGTPVRGEVAVYGTPRPVPPEVGMNLLHIGQEAVQNSLRHARARYVFVELTFEEAHIRLCIQDDGRGFDPESPGGGGGGFGLKGMRQRAERIGARLTVYSHIGNGTEVAVTVPMPDSGAVPVATDGHVADGSQNVNKDRELL